jgi:hypothetical protein
MWRVVMKDKGESLEFLVGTKYQLTPLWADPVLVFPQPMKDPEQRSGGLRH